MTINISGKEFGRLTALYPWKVESTRWLMFWLFICSCGQTKVINKSSVIRGNATSCGCYARELASFRLKERIKKTPPLQENHPNWRGGPKKLNRIIRNSVEYNKWRKEILTRDGFSCIDCKRVGGYLHSHHIIHLADIISNNNIKTMEEARNCQELWDISNGITLCETCHQTKHPELSLNMVRGKKYKGVSGDLKRIQNKKSTGGKSTRPGV